MALKFKSLVNALFGIVALTSNSCERERRVSATFLQDHRSGSICMEDARGGRTFVYKDPSFNEATADWQRGVNSEFVETLQAGETLVIVSDNEIWLAHVLKMVDHPTARLELTISKAGSPALGNPVVVKYGEPIGAGTTKVPWGTSSGSGNAWVAFDSPMDGAFDYELGMLAKSQTVTVHQHAFGSGREITIPNEVREGTSGTTQEGGGEEPE